MSEARLCLLQRGLRFHAVPMAVYAQSASRFALLPPDSPRLAALLREPAFARRVVGVFTQDVSLSDLRAAVVEAAI